MSFYAGIGSRSTPIEMVEFITRLAEHLGDEGWILRSGHAPGADQAFESGAGRKAEIFLPWPSFEKSEPLEADVIIDRPTPPAFEMASKFHPAWGRLSRGARSLHARNCHQVLGKDLDGPVDMVICWTPPGRVGGTGQALRIADSHGIPVYNLQERKYADMAAEWIGRLESQ